MVCTLRGGPKKIGKGFYCAHNPVPEEELKRTIKREYLK